MAVLAGTLIALATIATAGVAGLIAWQILWAAAGACAAAEPIWRRTTIAAAAFTAAAAWAAITYGAPPLNGPLGIRPTAGQIELGRKLFFDPRLSQNGTISCATCHDPSLGWSDGLELAVGINGRRGTRHSPTLINTAYVPAVFWDGRVTSTVPQALLPLSNPDEMGQQSQAEVVARLRLIPAYVVAFAEEFGIDPAQGSPITQANLALAIAAFETTIVSWDAPIDRRMAGDTKALTADAEVGYRLFQEANCMACHKPPHFTDFAFHNNGMEHAGKFNPSDRGRFDVLPQGARTARHLRAFKTPTLREIQATAPYNHAGNFADLRRVLLHYNAGGKRGSDNTVDRSMDPRIKPLGLSATQLGYLETFLREAFRGRSYPMIVEPPLP